MSKIKVIKYSNGKVEMVSMDKYRKLCDAEIKFETLGTKEIE